MAQYIRLTYHRPVLMTVPVAAWPVFAVVEATAALQSMLCRTRILFPSVGDKVSLIPDQRSTELATILLFVLPLTIMIAT